MTLRQEDQTRIDAIPVSHIAYHEGACCLESRQLIIAKLQQYPDIGSQLAAIPATFRWGPTRWPAYWCELLKPKDLVGDCGVHGDLASALLYAAGVEHDRGRAAIAPSEHSHPHWDATWNEAEASPAWLGPHVVHHEVLRIGDRWWDPTEARWFSGPGAALVAGIVMAVRTADGEWETAPTRAR